MDKELFRENQNEKTEKLEKRKKDKMKEKPHVVNNELMDLVINAKHNYEK